MKALQNLTSFVQTNQDIRKLEQLQKLIQSQMEIMPVQALGTEQEYKDPFSIEIKKQPTITESKTQKSISSKGPSKQFGNTIGSRTDTLSSKSEVKKVLKVSESILTSDIFTDQEAQRQKYLKMFIDNPSGCQKSIDDDLNERDEPSNNGEYIDDLNYSQTMNSKFRKSSKLGIKNSTKFSQDSNQFDRDSQANSELKLAQYNNKKVVKQNTDESNSEREIEFDLTVQGYQTNKTMKSLGKHVSFKQESPDNIRNKKENTLSRDSFSSLSDKKKQQKQDKDQISPDKLNELAAVLSQIQIRNEEVKRGVDSRITCENPKLLEVLMEHIVLNWDELAEQLLADEIDRL